MTQLTIFVTPLELALLQINNSNKLFDIVKWNVPGHFPWYLSQQFQDEYAQNSDKFNSWSKMPINVTK